MPFRLLLLFALACFVPSSAQAAAGFTDPPTRLSAPTSYAQSASVAYAPGPDTHRVVWTEAGGSSIKTRTVNGAGTINNDTTTVRQEVAGVTWSVARPSIAAGSDDWLISWMENSRQLRVQLYNQSGAVSSATLVDSSLTDANILSRSAYNADLDEWLVVWTINNVVKLQRVSSRGALIGSVQTVSTGTTANTPRIVYHPGVQKYLVSWHATDGSIFAKRVTATGSGGTLPISAATQLSYGAYTDPYRMGGGGGHNAVYDGEDNEYRLLWLGRPKDTSQGEQPTNVFGYPVSADGVPNLGAPKKYIDDAPYNILAANAHSIYIPQSDQTFTAYIRQHLGNTNQVNEVYMRRSTDTAKIGSADTLVSLANTTDNPGNYTGVYGAENLGVSLDTRRNQVYMAWARPGAESSMLGALGRGYALGFGVWYPDAVIEPAQDISLVPSVSDGTVSSYTLASGSTLPAGLSLNSITGVISGRLSNTVTSSSNVEVTINAVSTTSETAKVNVKLYLAPNQYYLSRQGAQPGKNTDVADPINVVSGNAYQQQEDFVLPGRGLSIQMLRTYNSLSPKDGPLGWGWSHIYQAKLTPRKARDSKGVWRDQQVLVDHQGSEIPFTQQSDGSFTSLDGIYDKLVVAGSDFVLTRKNGAKWKFNASGQLVEIRDRNGNTLTLTYSAGKLTGVSDASGKSITFVYTGARITSITAPDNRTFQYTYDASGNLSKYTDTTNTEWIYQYNSDHRLTRNSIFPASPDLPTTSQSFGYHADGRAAYSEGYFGHGRVDLAYNNNARTTTVTDKRGFASTYHFNARGDITQIDDPDGSNLQYGFDANANRVSATDQRGKTTNYQYDVRGNVTEIKQPKPADSDLEADRPTATMAYGDYDELEARTDPENKTTNYAYDIDGNLLTGTDERGEVTTYTYNSSGQPLTITDANGRISKFTYNPAGYLATSGVYADALDVSGKITGYSYNAWGDRTTVTNPLGKTVTTAYDSVSRPVTTTLPEVVTGEVDQIKYEYDSIGNLIRQEDALGHRRIYEYDRNYQLVHSEDESGRHSYYEYDGVGNLTKATSPAGVTTQYEYSKQGWLKKTVQADGSVPGRVTESTFRPDGLPATVTNPRGKATTYTYDNLGRLKEVLDAGNQDTDYSYDKRGLLTSITTARDNTTTFDYDARGARISKANQLSNTWEWRYDGAGLLQESEDALNRITAYTYNEEDQLTQTSFPSSTEPAIDQAYDDAGRLLTVTRDDKETAYQYDARDRLITETQSIGSTDRTLNYGYDRVDRLTSSKLPGNSVANTYTYDAAGRLTTLADARSNQTLYSYDSGGRISEIDYPGTTQSQAYTYTAAGETDTITHSLGLAGSRTLDHAYDKNGNLTGFTDIKGSDSATATLAYDDLDRLNSESYVKGSNTKSRAYSHDPAGNRSQLITNDGSGAVTTNYTYNNAERMTAAGTATYAYNANGEMTAETKNALTTAYTYSRLGETTSEGTSSFEYDGLSRRVKENHNSATTEQVYEGDQVAQRYNGTTLTKELIRDPSGTLAAEYTPALSSNKTAYHYQDLLGSSVEVSSGNLSPEQSTSYNAFGDTREVAGAAPSQFTYLGNQTNPAGKTHNFHARSYDAANGRFLSQDPVEGIQANPQSQNPYGYGFGNPYTNPDPTGLYPGEDFLEDQANEYKEALQDGKEVLQDGANFSVDITSDLIGLDPYYLQTNKNDVNQAELNNQVGNYPWSPSYSETEKNDAHHIIQNATVKNIRVPGSPEYSYSRAPAIHLDGPSSRIGTDHYYATQEQKRPGGGTYAEEREIAYRALRAGNVDRNGALKAIRRADLYFMKELGFKLKTETTVPGGRR